MVDMDSSQLIWTAPTRAPEIEFWEKQTNNLECIFEQLCEARVKRMASLLYQKDSSYYTSLTARVRNSL